MDKHLSKVSQIVDKSGRHTSNTAVLVPFGPIVAFVARDLARIEAGHVGAEGEN